jgi:hypothetical protein
MMGMKIVADFLGRLRIRASASLHQVEELERVDVDRC